MTRKKVVRCEYLLNNRFCRAVIEDDEGRMAREESCKNELKNYCCYSCINQKLCEISCNYLDKPVDITPATAREPKEKMEFTGEYLGGHPAFPVKSNVHMMLGAENLIIDELELFVPYKNIKRIENMTKEKITATRVFLLGIVGALWKKEQLYMVLTYRDKAADNDLSMVFRMDRIEEVQPLIYQKMINAKAKK
jgi:hypothetical protein